MGSCVDDLMRRFWNKIGRQEKAAFFSTIIVGFLGHISAIADFLVNHDDAALMETYGWLIGQGKWLHDIVYRLDAGSYYIAFTRLTAIFAVALAAALIVNALQVRSVCVSALVGATMILFPSSMSVFTYYLGLWDITLAVLAFWLIRRVAGWKGIFWGEIAFILMLGLYPPYIGFVAGLLLLDCLLDTLSIETNVVATLKKGVQYAAFIVAGLVGYYVILKIALYATHKSLGNYFGISEMATVHIADLLRVILLAYQKVVLFLWADAYGTRAVVLVWCYRFTVIAILASVFWIMIERRLYKRIGKVLLAAFCLGMFPFAVHLAAIIARNAKTHWIMIYPFVLCFIMLLILVDRMDYIRVKEATEKFGRATGKIFLSVSLLTCLLTLYSWTTIINEGYYALRIAYEGAYASLTKIVDDVYSNPDYQRSESVAIIGLARDHEDVQDDLAPIENYTGITDRNFVFAYGKVPQLFIEKLLSPDFTYADDSACAEIKNTQEFKDMPSYPYSGYVQEIDGVIVVKLSD